MLVYNDGGSVSRLVVRSSSSAAFVIFDPEEMAGKGLDGAATLGSKRMCFGNWFVCGIDTEFLFIIFHSLLISRTNKRLGSRN